MSLSPLSPSTLQLEALEALPSKKVSKQAFLSSAGSLQDSFTHEEGTSPRKKILAVFQHEFGYETFGYAEGEGWKHYIFS